MPSARTPPPQYRITDLGTLGSRSSRATAINNRGQVVGVSPLGKEFAGPEGMSPYRSFLWSSGRMSDCGVDHSEAIAINNKGHVLCGPGSVSWSTNGPEPKRPSCFLWIDKSTHNLKEGLGYSDINDAGEMSVTAPPRSRFWKINRSSTEIEGRACVWKNGAIQYLPEPKGADGSFAHALNNRGMVIGCVVLEGTQRGARWHNGKFQLIGPVVHGDKFSGTYPTAINDRGQVVGEVSVPNGSSMPFLWEAGQTQYLKSEGSPSDINEQGQIVGTRGTTALLWQNGEVYDLNNYIPAKSGWKLTWATGINDRGQIVGVGKLNKQRRAFLLTPIPPTHSQEKTTPLPSQQP